MSETIDRTPWEPVGVVGLGLLGRGIAACLLGHGFRVVGYDRNAEVYPAVREHIDDSIRQLVEKADFPRERLQWRDRYVEAQACEDLAPCRFVIESAVESLSDKRAIFAQLEAVLADDAVIASNTSAIPITLLQEGRAHPARFVGMHWGEPAHILRFLEIIRGEQTSDDTFERTATLAEHIGKEPSLVRRDVRGFVTNRLFYALLREAFHLLETGVADVETIDRSFRTDIGWWATIAGPFRWLDLTGLPPYAAVMEELLPQLCNSGEVPATLRKLIDEGARGVSNQRGFYPYTAEEAKRWEQTWVNFTWDIRALADKHLPADH